MDIEKRIEFLQERLKYAQDILDNGNDKNLNLMATELSEFIHFVSDTQENEAQIEARLGTLEDLFNFLELKIERSLTAMDMVRIVRHPLRVCLKDILENVYDNYTEIGGQDNLSIDPSMVIARAYITRQFGKKIHHQPVMVIGQEKGHGQEFRNGGSVKPWGNAKALYYMKVAETENIPIHTYIFTPGSYPIEDYPGAAQQIAKNIYEMAGIKVPIVAIFSEGGSGGAEAIGLADTRMMFSHGYYSVISPEGAAAIEGRLRNGERATPELIQKCAENLKMLAVDNVRMGYIDWHIKEPALGARPYHYGFFKKVRRGVVASTDELVLGIRGIKFFRKIALRKVKTAKIYVRWSLSANEKSRLIRNRYSKFRKMGQNAYLDNRTALDKYSTNASHVLMTVKSFVRYDLLGKPRKLFTKIIEEIQAEGQVAISKIYGYFSSSKINKADKEKKELVNAEELTALSMWTDESLTKEIYVSPQSKEDRAISCPHSYERGCLDQWAPDLFGENAGVCVYCAHHFKMEYQWCLYNVFDKDSLRERFKEIESINPLAFDGFDEKLKEAKSKTGQKCSCLAYETSIENTKLIVAVLTAPFRGGSVGAAEGEKFIRSVELARKKRYPFLAYVHGTAGIRIQEGTNGVIQMPRCTLAIRHYIDAGGLYVVLYDTNSYAGPVASFLGCSPYQFAVRSANVGFAGPGVIQETTGMVIPPDYHSAFNALSRGHIHGIWDRREIRSNMNQVLQTMGGSNLYYR